MASGILTAPVDSPVTPALCLQGITKSFGATLALDNVSVNVEAGTVHALLGENGAGKSTLLGVIAGRLAPTAGQGFLFGSHLPFADPRASRAVGIASIYQELTIVPTLSALANVFLGVPESRRGWVARRAMARRFRELSDRLGTKIDPNAAASSLSVAQQQELEIMRALHLDARVILLDEPTASLAANERRSLFRLIRDLRAEGVTMVFVSHNLDEVLDICDRATVFRNGRLHETRDVCDWTKADLVKSMLGDVAADLGLDTSEDARYVRQPQGRSAIATFQAQSAEPERARLQPPVLRVSDVSIPGVLRDVSFDVHEGEIIGVAGLVGSGRTSLLRALTGLERRATGTIALNGVSRRLPASVREAVKSGIALVPEDRKDQGLVLSLSGTMNVMLPRLSSASTRGWCRRGRMRELAREAGESFGIDPRRLEDPVGTLSGGNQQKVLLARGVSSEPKVLLADEPTRGIDLGAKTQILASLRAFADNGSTVVMVSSETEELIGIADRIIVLAQGRVTAELDNTGMPITEQEILAAAFDLEEPHVAV